MTLILRTSSDLPDSSLYESWLAIDHVGVPLDPARELADLADLIEEHYEPALQEWLSMTPSLAVGYGAQYAHAPACAANASDLGVMLTWSRIIDAVSSRAQRILIVCNDPWMFRHLEARGSIVAGRRPSMLRATLLNIVRGYVARTRVALKAAASRIGMFGQSGQFPRKAAVLLVYGHPGSTAFGYDAYFGDLLNTLPGVVRLLHVDCSSDRARHLSANGASFSLHGWGSLFSAVTLPFVKWRPSRALRQGANAWLIHRAAAIEGGTGQAAMIRWQEICQAGWLRETSPTVVSWPWENHAWEKMFVRACRAQGTATIGYQHATIGRHEMNYSPRCNIDGMASIPDSILASGALGKSSLERLGYPPDRVAVGGALRFGSDKTTTYDPNGAIFVALPFDQRVAAEMVEAVGKLAGTGARIYVRDHPMTPFDIHEHNNLRRAPGPLCEMDAVSAVIYSGTTVGLEAYLMGLPTFRFKPTRKPVNDILPQGFEVATLTAKDIAKVVADPRVPTREDRERIFGTPDYALWRQVLGVETTSA